ncbi:MAG: WGR domain-containing protein [Xanthobacteraceae bacterium]
MSAVVLWRIDDTRHMRRFYRLDVQPDLFGGVLLVKEWGRIGARGRIVDESYDSEALAAAAMQRQAERKRRRGSWCHDCWLGHIGARRAGPLFASRQGGSGPTPHVLTRQRVGQIVRAIAVAAGISKRVYPHLLRHTGATRLLALGMDITDLQRFLAREHRHDAPLCRDDGCHPAAPVRPVDRSRGARTGLGYPTEARG